MRGDNRGPETMRRHNGRRIVALLLCIVPVSIWSYVIRRDFQSDIKMADFSTIYFAARCAVHRADPYDRAAYLQETISDKASFATSSAIAKRDVDIFMRCVYLPTTLFAFIPFALPPWTIAQNLFLISIAFSLALAAWAIWDLAGVPAPVPCVGLVVFWLTNSMLLLLVGNPAGIVIGFGIVAAWCFLKKRYEPAGVVLLALGLIIKPHDVGFVWLYFLLAGRGLRKRALQAMALAAVVGICSLIWIVPISPHWTHELHSNVEADFAHGGINDPGPGGITERTFGPVISLQNTLSIFKDNPHFYNPMSYLAGGGLLLVWAGLVLLKRFTREGALLGLAAVSILTMLPVYHRPHDAKLLALTIPGCAVLWAARGASRWVALTLTAAAILVTSDLPIVFLTQATKSLPTSVSTLGGQLTLLLIHPAPLVLLAAGCFYLWAYVRYEPAAAAGETRGMPDRGERQSSLQT